MRGGIRGCRDRDHQERVPDRAPRKRQDIDSRGYDRAGFGTKRSHERRPRLHRRRDRAGHDAGYERGQPRVEGTPGQCARHPRRRGLRRGRLHSPEGCRLRDPGSPRPGPYPGRHGARVAQGREGRHPSRHRRQPLGQGAYGLRGRGRRAQRTLWASHRPTEFAHRTRERPQRHLRAPQRDLLCGRRAACRDHRGYGRRGRRGQDATLRGHSGERRHVARKVPRRRGDHHRGGFRRDPQGDRRGRHIPVLAAGAERMIGIDRLLDVIAGSAPSPSDLERWITEEGEEIPCDPEGPFAAYVFKTYVDPYAGRLSVLRIVGGRCRSDEALTNPRTDSSERLGGISHLVGKEREPVDEAVAGDIIAVAKLRDTASFDTICKPEKPMSFEPVELPEPTAAFAVGAKARGEEEKVFDAIRRVVDEDPSLKLERTEATGEDILSGLAQMHVELALERIEHRYGVEVEARPPKVPLMETITGSAQAQGRYKKQTGGRGQFGDARIELSPLPRGSGFEFENGIVGGAIPRQFIPAVEKGIIEAMAGGNIAGYPVVDVKVRLHDGAFHTVDSSEMAFKVAGSMAFKNAIEKARPVLLEPYVKVEVLVPSELVGDVMGDLSSRRGRPMGVEQRGERQVIQAEVPQIEMLTYARDLRSITGGRANFHVGAGHYEEVPPNLVEKVLAATEREEEKAVS